MAKNIKKHRFNVIDALLIIVILAIICAAAVIFSVPEKFGLSDAAADEDQYVNIEYELQFRKVPEVLKNVIEANYNVNDTVYDASADRVFGELVGVRFEKGVYTGVDLESGKTVLSRYEDLYDVVFTIRTEAKISDVDRYSIGGFEVSVGSAMKMKLPYFTYSGYCIKVAEVTDAAKEVE